MLLTKFAQALDGINDLYVPTEDLEENIAHLSTNVVLFSGIALVVLVVLAAMFKDKVEKVKAPLFGLIATLMLGSTLFLAGSTVYLNVKSDSGGPVHWHADIEYWACDSEVELRDPTGTLSNKIGTSVLHEHDDQRIHLEGVVVDDEVDASLGKFMHVVGGAITGEAMVIPVNEPERGNYFEDEEDGDGPNPADITIINNFLVQGDDGPYLRFIDGQKCGTEDADVQVFLMKVNEDGKTYTQTKLDNPRDYVITDNPNVPPGDCIIFEFSPTKERTDKLCAQYGVRDIDRCAEFGVEEDKREICELREVDANGNPIDHNAVNNSDSQDDATQSDDNDSENPQDDDATTVSEIEINALCRQFFNDDGTPTGIEIAAIKSNGETLDIDSECESYRQNLLNGTQGTGDSPL